LSPVFGDFGDGKWSEKEGSPGDLGGQILKKKHPGVSKNSGISKLMVYNGKPY